MRTRFLAATMAAMLLGNTVQAQTVPSTDAPTAPPVVVPGPAGYVPPLATVPVPAPVPAPLTAPVVPAPVVPTGTPTALPPPAPDNPGVVLLPPPSTESAPPATQWPLEQPTVAHHPSLLRERLRLLDATLIPLAERSHDARVTEGIVGLVAGAAFIGLGAFVGAESTDGLDGLNDVLYISGAFSMATGAMDLFWVPARERLTRQYQAMPRATSADRRAQVLFGEQSLNDMVADGSRRRLVNALVSIGVDLGMLAFIYSPQLFEGQPWPQPPTINYLVFGITGIAVITGLVGLLGRTEEERLRDTYEHEVTSLRQLPPVTE